MVLPSSPPATTRLRRSPRPAVFSRPLCPAHPIAGGESPAFKEYSVFVKRTLAAVAVAVLTSLAGTAAAPPGRGNQAGSRRRRPAARQAHAHNDYEHDRPCSMRWSMASPAWKRTCGWWTASCWWPTTGGRPARVTLESLYLDPLQDWSAARPQRLPDVGWQPAASDRHRATANPPTPQSSRNWPSTATS